MEYDFVSMKSISGSVSSEGFTSLGCFREVTLHPRMLGRKDEICIGWGDDPFSAIRNAVQTIAGVPIARQEAEDEESCVIAYVEAANKVLAEADAAKRAREFEWPLSGSIDSGEPRIAGPGILRLVQAIRRSGAPLEDQAHALARLAGH